MTRFSITTRRRGTAYILAMIVLSLFTAMASAFAVFSHANIRTSKNAADIHRAQLAAESGMAFSIRTIRRLALPSDTDDDSVMLNIAQALEEYLSGSGNLPSGGVSSSDSGVLVPLIATEDGGFQVRILRLGDGTLSLESEGVLVAFTGSLRSIWLSVTGTATAFSTTVWPAAARSAFPETARSAARTPSLRRA